MTSVRHSLVGRIVDAYTKYDAEKQVRAHERREASEFANRAERRKGLGSKGMGKR